MRGWLESLRNTARRAQQSQLLRAAALFRPLRYAAAHRSSTLVAGGGDGPRASVRAKDEDARRAFAFERRESVYCARRRLSMKNVDSDGEDGDDALSDGGEDYDENEERDYTLDKEDHAMRAEYVSMVRMIASLAQQAAAIGYEVYKKDSSQFVVSSGDSVESFAIIDWVLDCASGEPDLQALILQTPGNLQHICECLSFSFLYRSRSGEPLANGWVGSNLTEMSEINAEELYYGGDKAKQAYRMQSQIESLSQSALKAGFRLCEENHEQYVSVIDANISPIEIRTWVIQQAGERPELSRLLLEGSRNLEHICECLSLPFLYEESEVALTSEMMQAAKSQKRLLLGGPPSS